MTPFAASGSAEGGVAPTELHCPSIWPALVNGQLQVVDEFSEGPSVGLVLRVMPTRQVAFSPRNLAMLERLLRGTCAKVIALDSGLAESSVAQILKSMLRGMGFSCSALRVSPLLVLLFHLAQHATPTARVRVERVARGAFDCLLVRADLDSAAFAALAPAEKAVMQQRVLGRSLADIAAARNTSARTVANQIAHAYYRLGVSGRLNLLQLLAV